MPTFEGWHTDDDGSPRNGKSVFYRAASDAEPNPNAIETPTVVTDVNGHWTLTTPAGEWDVYLLDGPTVRMWKARTNLPLSFGAEQIAVDAGIELTKLDEGTGDDDVNPLTVPTNLDQRINQILSQIKDGFGGTNWNDPPLATLVELDNHMPHPIGVHGLPVGVNFLGTSQGASGYHVKWGTATTGSETNAAPYYYAGAVITFPTPFAAACVAAFCNSNLGWAWGMAQARGTGGFAATLMALTPGQVAGQELDWLALGF